MILSGLSSCHSVPEGVLDQEKMAQLMADIHMAEAVIDFNYGVYATDSARQAFKQSVYMDHGVDQDMVDSSLTWYGHHIEEYISVYNRTIEILDERKTEFASLSGAQIAVAGDSVHVWTGPGHISVSPLMESRILSFCLTPDSTWQNGDIYTLSFKSLNNMKPLQTRLLVDYENGSTAYADDFSTQKAVTTLKLQIDSLQQAQRIYGYISFPKDDNLTYEVDSIRLTRVRVHLDPNGYYPSKAFKFGIATASSSSDSPQEQTEAPADTLSMEHRANPASRQDYVQPSKRREQTSPRHDLPESSAGKSHTQHRQGAAEHKVTDRHDNAAKRQSAMPRQQAPLTRQPARNSRQEAPAKEAPK